MIGHVGLNGVYLSSVSALSGLQARLHETAFGQDFDGDGLVGVPPVITVQPLEQAVDANGSVTLSVESDDAITYQWQKDGVDLTDANGSTYTINGFSEATHKGFTRWWCPTVPEV